MVLAATGEDPPDELRADVSGTGQFPDEMFQEFVSLVLTILTKASQASRMMGTIEAFGAENSINPGALQSITRSWLSYLRAAQKSNVPPKAVRDDLMTLGLPEDKATLVARVYKKNIGALARAVAGRTLTVNQLTDMQWRFGVTSGSSEIRKSGKTFLQMKMTINNGVGNDDVFMELTLPQFFSLMKEMQKAKVALDQMS
mmetsp:Transcript_8705/g.22525  ORF Transcript_8705/g.22525 Transcript_8705/m.22525 type:complete len:200 (-) Transcript_8705:206-805(-)|eukprot:CAMPEP_0182926398 /NCGR_PEP_ID=MMETSP0105_2-20130417/11965_1 /TAXON_ID=81532 ORGANISM="Acanthoeca-like sp., Strain 10tr" /NCGR_SAMPLE_ID=MMETSP0105_2 /ASSEMBLY_ACC=CAM_ASM_000205 /LENGTH=199 /DNA_ID=CAMNT_0025064291 /DNA_START=37 /DNA_END=636 /DNA_ORIENTATION=+